MFAAKITPPVWTSADEERSLAILCQLILDEIAATASAEQRRGLLVAIGYRLAGLTAIPADADLDTLADRANHLWISLNWGSAGFELDDHGIDIVHRGLPTRQRDQLQDWEQIVPPILEGAYGCWFGRLGGNTGKLSTRILRERAGEVELRYGL